jgi:NAD(P)-dependent dehydrogenase (short-subunit alcohol dehydrogenase family)
MSQKVAIVTGASRGIGKRLSIDLAKAGYDVACVARSSRARPSKLPGTVDETAEAVRAHGRRALAEGLDVRDEQAVAALAERVYDSWGRCDLLVNNAAVAPPRPALEDSTGRWRLAVDVNLNGPFYLAYYLCGRMAKHGGGQVINVSSAAAVYPQFGRASYTATKRALEGLTEALAHDLRDQVAVNCLRIDVPVYSEGFEFTMPGDYSEYEDPVIISDAVLWLTRQPITHTGRIHTVNELRAEGIVREPTPHGQG